MNDPSVLAFDTSSDAFTAAFWRGGRTWSAEFAPGAKHADAVFGEIERLLKKARARMADADVIAVGLGPGSFTGIRVGVSAAKTLAYAAGKKLMGFSSLEVQSRNWPDTNLPDRQAGAPVYVAQDARRSNVYAAAFWAGETVRPPRLLSPEDFVEDADPSFYFMGSALALNGLAQRLEARVGRGRIDPDPALTRPRAARMVPLALERWKKGAFDDPLRLVPHYLYEIVTAV